MTQGGVRNRPLRCGDQCYLVKAWPQSCRVQALKSPSSHRQRHTGGTRRDKTGRRGTEREGVLGRKPLRTGDIEIYVSILFYTHSWEHSKNMAAVDDTFLLLHLQIRNAALTYESQGMQTVRGVADSTCRQLTRYIEAGQACLPGWCV